MRSKAKRFDFVGLLEPSPVQAMDDMVACRTEDFGDQRFCQGTRKRALKAFYYRRLFHRDEMVECSVLQELELTAAEMLGRKAVSARVLRSDMAQ